VTVSELGLPDTVLVREALALVRRALPEPIVDHSLRAYLLADAYAKATARVHDEEGLCLAAIFHDVGLGSDAPRGVAFTHTSSGELARFLGNRGVARARIAPLAEAILFHMQLLPRWAKGNEVGLLQVGAWMDVVGLRRGRVAADAARIDALLPKGNFARTFNARLLATMTSPAACLRLLFPVTLSGGVDPADFEGAR
jgi:hypothetical protein